MLSPNHPITPPTAISKQIVRLGEHVYCAVGYALSNVTMIVVEGGKVIVDTTESVTAAREIRAAFDGIVPGPVKAIIYTHSHPDHVLGTTIFHEPGVKIWAHACFHDEMRTQMGTISRTFRRRAARQFGDRLPPDRIFPTGIGPRLRLDDNTVPPLLFPTNTFRGRASLSFGDDVLELHEAPGETRDHLFVHVPRHRTIVAGDNIYRAFPNLYAIRGVAPRPARDWVDSLDHMRLLAPAYLAPGHTEPIFGAARIDEILTVYRDAISYLVATVIRLTNEGHTPDDMVHMIQLPEHLATHPYLQETYGNLEWSIRGIYEGYLGWFDGNPTKLAPLPPSTHAARLTELAGGTDNLEQTIAQELSTGDPQWAAELCDVLLAGRHRIPQVRRWKAEAIDLLAARSDHPVAKHYYFSAAEELRGVSLTPARAPINADTLRDVPVELLLESLPMRLRVETTHNMTLRVGFDFTDSDLQFQFIIRCGVGEVRRGLTEPTDFTVITTEKDFKALVSGTLRAAQAALTGRLRCTGGLRKLRMLRSLLHPM